MKFRMILTLCLTLCSALWLPTNVNAAALPDGTYLESCINCRQQGDTLSCWCRRDGQTLPKVSYLRFADRCVYVENVHGQLACTRGHLRPLPAGSYLTVCNHCSFDGAMLSCSCRPGGTYFIRETQINVAQCKNDIVYTDDGLRCSNRPVPPGLRKQLALSATRYAPEASTNVADKTTKTPATAQPNATSTTVAANSSKDSDGKEKPIVIAASKTAATPTDATTKTSTTANVADASTAQTSATNQTASSDSKSSPAPAIKTSAAAHPNKLQKLTRAPVPQHEAVTPIKKSLVINDWENPYAVKASSKPAATAIAQSNDRRPHRTSIASRRPTKSKVLSSAKMKVTRASTKRELSKKLATGNRKTASKPTKIAKRITSPTPVKRAQVVVPAKRAQVVAPAKHAELAAAKSHQTVISEVQSQPVVITEVSTVSVEPSKAEAPVKPKAAISEQWQPLTAFHANENADKVGSKSSTKPAKSASQKLSSVKLPRGNYLSSCMSCRLSHHRLACLCPTAKKALRIAKLPHADHCKTVSNEDGQLVCHGNVA